MEQIRRCRWHRSSNYTDTGTDNKYGPTAKMKALLVLDSLPRGGAEMQALDVCRNATANGLDLSVAAGSGALETEFRGSGIPFYPLRRRLPLDPLLVLRLRGLIRRHGYEIVHAHQAVDALHAYLATRGTDAKCVVSYQGHFPDSKNRRSLAYLIPRVAANISCFQGPSHVAG